MSWFTLCSSGVVSIQWECYQWQHLTCHSSFKSSAVSCTSRHRTQTLTQASVFTCKRWQRFIRGVISFELDVGPSHQCQEMIRGNSYPMKFVCPFYVTRSIFPCLLFIPLTKSWIPSGQGCQSWCWELGAEKSPPLWGSKFLGGKASDWSRIQNPAFWLVQRPSAP